MNPNELNNMLKTIKENNDLVFGSRYLQNAGSEDDDLITVVGNYIFSFLEKYFLILKLMIFYILTPWKYRID